MKGFFEAFELFQRIIFALEPEEGPFVIIAVNTRDASLLLAIAGSSQGEPEELTVCQLIGSQREIFASIHLPCNVVIVGELELIDGLIEV